MSNVSSLSFDSKPSRTHNFSGNLTDSQNQHRLRAIKAPDVGTESNLPPGLDDCDRETLALLLAPIVEQWDDSLNWYVHAIYEEGKPVEAARRSSHHSLFPPTYENTTVLILSVKQAIEQVTVLNEHFPYKPIVRGYVTAFEFARLVRDIDRRNRSQYRHVLNPNYSQNTFVPPSPPVWKFWEQRLWGSMWRFFKKNFV